MAQSAESSTLERLLASSTRSQREAVEAILADDRVSVDFILERFPLRVKAVIRAFAYLVGLAGFSLLSWRVFLLAMHYFTATRGDATDTLHIPKVPFVLTMSVGCGVMALVLLVDIVRSISEVRQK